MYVVNEFKRPEFLTLYIIVTGITLLFMIICLFAVIVKDNHDL